ncbi:hypothetical protein Acr_26g0002350 [Actinidia rufa]|uniref:Uncharacterized protein n=1 Tax=Actinidia rufa TaxID=165716 RepID=A0A7J0H1R4_9ERIC|nr:hypothetical protein Acr_26g0002350 [Actinidia rufa]
MMASSRGDNTEGKSTDGATASGDEEPDIELSSNLSSSSQVQELCQNHGSPPSLDRMVEESKGVSSVTKSTPSAKGVVVGEKHLREEASNVSLSKAKSKGKEALPPLAVKKAKSATSIAPMTKGAKLALAPEEGTSAKPGAALGPGASASMLGNALVAEKILARVILPANKEYVDKLSLDQQAVVLGSSLAVRSRDIENEASFQIARAELAELEMVQAQTRAIELEGLLAQFNDRERRRPPMSLRRGLRPWRG